MKHKKIKYMWGIYDADKHDKMNTHPQEGKNKWLILFSASMLLQFPGLNERGVLFYKSFS
jgi:hypothetical protein